MLFGLGCRPHPPLLRPLPRFFVAWWKSLAFIIHRALGARARAGRAPAAAWSAEPRNALNFEGLTRPGNFGILDRSGRGFQHRRDCRRENTGCRRRSLPVSPLIKGPTESQYSQADFRVCSENSGRVPLTGAASLAESKRSSDAKLISLNVSDRGRGHAEAGWASTAPRFGGFWFLAGA